MPTMVAAPTEAEIRELVKTNPRARERALKILFDRQTVNEQAMDATTERNGVGFTGYDAELLSSFAKQVIENRGNRPAGQRLSARQHEIAAKRLPKYARQLREEAIRKAESALPETERHVQVLARVTEQREWDARRTALVQDRAVETLFSGCPECHGDLTIDTNVGGELVEMPCPRCVGARV